MDICLRVLKESSKRMFDSYIVRNSVLIISHITFLDCCMHIVTDKLSRNSCIKDIQRLQSIFICILLKHTISFKPYHLNLGGSFSPNSPQLVTDRQAQFFLISPKLALARSISRRVKVPE